MEQLFLILVIALAFLFAFINGFQDGFNVIANSVLSRSMVPVRALLVAGVAALLAPLFLGVTVAVTLGRDIINPFSLQGGGNLSPVLFVFSGLISAIVWSLLTWWVGMPHSSTHALLGGIVGGGIAAFGTDIVVWSILFPKVILFLFLSPWAGLALAYLATKISAILPRSSPLEKKSFLRRIQWTSLVFLSAGHGSNNAQKAMGILTLGMVAAGSLQAFRIPGWGILGCALSLSLGVLAGGWKLLRILGERTFRITPIHAFNAQIAGGVVILIAGILGTPISTSQIVKASIIGVGAGYRKKTVNLMLLKDILIAWLFTIPASAFLSATIYWTISGVLGYGMGSFEQIMKILGQ